MTQQGTSSLFWGTELNSGSGEQLPHDAEDLDLLLQKPHPKERVVAQQCSLYLFRTYFKFVVSL